MAIDNILDLMLDLTTQKPGKIISRLNQEFEKQRLLSPTKEPLFILKYFMLKPLQILVDEGVIPEYFAVSVLYKTLKQTKNELLKLEQAVGKTLSVPIDSRAFFLINPYVEAVRTYVESDLDKLPGQLQEEYKQLQPQIDTYFLSLDKEHNKNGKVPAVSRISTVIDLFEFYLKKTSPHID